MKSEEKKLQQLFRKLTPDQQDTLLAFAEFLAARKEAESPAAIPQPLSIPRPEQETVIKAVQRLTATYPMLDRGRLLHETAHYVSQHVMHGRPAREVIDELELVFSRHYKVKVLRGEKDQF